MTNSNGVDRIYVYILISPEISLPLLPLPMNHSLQCFHFQLTQVSHPKQIPEIQKEKKKSKIKNNFQFLQTTSGHSATFAIKEQISHLISFHCIFLFFLLRHAHIQRGRHKRVFQIIGAVQRNPMQPINPARATDPHRIALLQLHAHPRLRLLPRNPSPVHWTRPRNHHEFGSSYQKKKKKKKPKISNQRKRLKMRKKDSPDEKSTTERCCLEEFE